MSRIRILVFIVFLGLSPVGSAHDVEYPAVVVNTDIGLDDAVALALILQSPDLDVRAIVACEGAAGGLRAVEHLERMLIFFNRTDVTLYAPASCALPSPVPEFRSFVETSVAAALPEPQASFHREFSPDAFSSERTPITIIALGPLTNIATALELRPELIKNIRTILIAGRPESERNWNLRYNISAYEQLRSSGVRMTFIAADKSTSGKPDAWSMEELRFGAGTSVGEAFLQRLFANPIVRKHYLERFREFSDELTVLYLADQSVFWDREGIGTSVPNNRSALAELFTRIIDQGRQRKDRVVLVSGSLPDEILQSDVRERKAGIVAKNGESEWFAQLLMNELHEHLGAYSIIGVKMGLRAAELLNAPQSGMKIVSRSPARPPFSCLNDGLIVATGCTPGRMLFRHEPGGAWQTITAEFEYNGRRIAVSLKPEYQERVKSRFESILANARTEDHEYWDAVRAFGLEIWENWHRRDIFEVQETASEAAKQ